MQISILSRTLDTLGRTFIGRPENWGMPSDFYFEQGDRKAPTSGELAKIEVIRARIEQHHFARHLSLFAAAYAGAISLIGCAGLLLLSTIFHGAHR